MDTESSANLMETAEDIQAAINELQIKLQVAQDKEMGEKVELVEIPLAKGFIKLNKFTSVPIRNVTPAEVAILVAEHHKAAGGMPITNLVRQTDTKGRAMVYEDDGEGGEKGVMKEVLVERSIIKVDPRAERARLCAKYRTSKVTALFPGLVPVFPKTFRQAMSAGLATEMPDERLMDFQLAEPAGA